MDVKKAAQLMQVRTCFCAAFAQGIKVCSRHELKCGGCAGGCDLGEAAAALRSTPALSAADKDRPQLGRHGMAAPVPGALPRPAARSALGAPIGLA